MKHTEPVFQIFATPTWGGGEQFVYDLTRRLLDDKRRVVLISRPSEIIRQRVEGLNAPYHTLPLKGALDLVSAWRLARLMLKYRPEIIHVHHFKNAFTAAYARLLCRPFGIRPRIILTRHLVRRGKRGGLYRWLYTQIDRIAFVSELARREFLAGNPGINPAKLCVIHNSVPEIGSLQTDGPLPDLHRKYGVPAQTPLLLFSGRLVPEKGCEVLLRACARLGERPFALFLAGSGSKEYEKRLHEMARQTGIAPKTHFLGFVRHVRHLLQQADLCVFPSVWAEPFGLTIIEAMQAGRALVTTDNGAQPEFVDNGITGLLVPPSDDEALARAIARLLDDADLRRRMGDAARQTFEQKLSYERFYERYLTLYA